MFKCFTVLQFFVNENNIFLNPTAHLLVHFVFPKHMVEVSIATLAPAAVSRPDSLQKTCSILFIIILVECTIPFRKVLNS